MTRLAILADIHGNWPALEAVIDDMAQFDPDHVIVVGDAVHRAPFNTQVLEYIVKENWSVVRGNNEFYLLNHQTTRAPAGWNESPLVKWLYEQAGGFRSRIAAWPDILSLRYPDGPPVFVMHGSPADITSGFLHADWPDDATLAAQFAARGVCERFVIGGHIHLALDRQVGRRRIFNPGAVGMPFDGIPLASYLLLDSAGDDWTPTFRRVAFDYERVFREYERQRFVERCGYLARLVVEELRIARPLVRAFHLWHKDCCPGKPLSVARVEEFLEVDWWPYMLDEYRLNLDAIPAPPVHTGAQHLVPLGAAAR